jgi:hypothetical protein
MAGANLELLSLEISFSHLAAINLEELSIGRNSFEQLPTVEYSEIFPVQNNQIK